MEFRKKKEILEYLGKDVKDVRLIDRMIKRGEIKKEGCVYIYESREVELEKEIKNLSEANEELKEKLDSMLRDDKISSKESMVDKNINLSDLEKKLAESEDNLEYQMKEYERLERETKEEVWMYQECIRKCYLWATNEKRIKITRPDFRDNVLKLKKSLPGEDNQ